MAQRVGHPTDRIIGDASAIAALRAQVRQLASFDSVGNPHVPTLLLEGETGTGKGLLARVVHDSGPRAPGPFIDVNCGAIPDTMLEAELFGYESGAFTDAKRAKPGLFEAASGGTLFLDEIDSLPSPLQSKLLSAIEEKSIRRLGAVSARRVDVKLIVATQRSLAQLVAENGFRADLYHRLAVLVLEIPRLRDRGDDVTILADRFLARYAAAHSLPGRRLSDAARQWLLVHSWPGNIRELSHLMERVTLLGRDLEIDRETLERFCLPSMPPRPALSPTTASQVAIASGPVGERSPANQPGTHDEPARIRDALVRSGGNVLAAARILGLGRNALRYRMRRYGIERPSLLDVGERAEMRRDELGGALARAADRRGVTPDLSMTPARAAISSPVDWERRHIALMIISLTFPLDPAGGEPPYEPWTIATRWRQLLEEKVRGFGAVVVERSAARLTAVLGVPRALEQAPERAVQAALTIQQLSADTRAASESAATPELRLALHVGPVMVETSGEDSSPRLIPLGDTWTIPERLLGHAGAGEILVSATLARRIEGQFELRERELRVGPAPGDRLSAWSVVGIRPGSSTLERRGAEGLSRFVGRSRELAALREAFEGARDGSGQVVFVVGEAGIGKSRLLFEFRRQLAAAPHLWVEGCCASYGVTTAFLPVADALRQLFTIDDRDGEAVATEKISHGVFGLGSDLSWTVPLVRQLLSFPPGDQATEALDAASRRSETFRALEALTLRAAQTQPLILVVEDLHWADPASEESLVFLADQIGGSRTLLICSYRPGYRNPFADRSYHTRLTLRALSPSDTASLAGEVLGAAELPPELRELIARKAEGNPFFVEEVTKSLLESGALRGESERVEPRLDLAEIAVPGSIHDVLMARIDRLADESRRALQIASVIGREFVLRLLARITQAGDRMTTQVEELRALELIYEKTRLPELAYMFKHALTHDVAYASVVAEQRRALHRVVGLAIEELYADRLAEHYETLAHHFGRAEAWEKAFDYHERASEKAAASFANRAVVVHCEEALRIAGRLGERVSDQVRGRLEERLGLARFYLSEFAAAANAYQSAAAHSGGEPRARALHLASAGLASFWGREYERARQIVEQARELSRSSQIAAGEAMGLSLHGFFAGVLEGDVTSYQRSCEEALALCRSSDDEPVAAMIHFNLAQVAEWTGDFRSAIEHAESAIAWGRRLQLAHLVIWPTWFLGKAACCLGEYGRAIALLEEASQTCDRIGDRAWKSRILNTLGWCFAEIGSTGRARRCNQESSDLGRALGDAEIVANAEINLAWNHLALGDTAQAIAHLDPIQESLGRPADPWMRWRYSLHLLDALGRVELARNEPDRALALAQQEIDGARRHRVFKVEARALELRGRSLIVLEHSDEARAALEEAIYTAERISHPRIVWQALGLLAGLEQRIGSRTRAQDLSAKRQALIESAAHTLGDAELKRELCAAALPQP